MSHVMINESSLIPSNEVPPRQRFQPSKLVIVGHVDHGKSTLIGRILHDTHSLEAGKVEKVRKICEEQHKPFEWAFLLDALEEEQLQGITIDTTRVEFQTEKRDFLIIDAPGHKEFLKNMISGAANAHAAVLLIDALEGIREQSKRHGHLVSLLGIQNIIVLVNKMDLVDYREEVFQDIKAEYLAFLNPLGLVPQHVVPVSARNGDNIVTLSPNMPWYSGDPLLDILERIEPVRDDDPSAPLRIPIQDVYKFDDLRILAGRIESGALHVGDAVRVLPSGHRAKVKSIEVWPEPENPMTLVEAGYTVGITLDEALFTDRGHMIVHADSPVQSTRYLNTHIFWMGQTPLSYGVRYKLKIGPQETYVLLHEIKQVVNASSLEVKGEAQGPAQGEIQSPAEAVYRHEVAEVVFRAEQPIVADAFQRLPKTGRFVVMEGIQIVGGGIILAEKHALADSEHQKATFQERNALNGHRSGIIQIEMPDVELADAALMYLEKKLLGFGLKVYAVDLAAVPMDTVSVLLDAGLIVLACFSPDLPNLMAYHDAHAVYSFSLSPESGTPETQTWLLQRVTEELPAIREHFSLHDQALPSYPDDFTI